MSLPKFLKNMSRRGRTFLVVAVLLLATVLYTTSRIRAALAHFDRIGLFMANPVAYPNWLITGGERCGTAPMLMPTTGFIGVAWDVGLPPLYRHTGYDIFGPDGADNVTPIYATFDGYLTREASWRSAVIIRHPDFNALPEITDGTPIWTYYTHMASRDGAESFIDPAFPAGTREAFVTAGTLLGYQGSWSGSSDFELNRHLHLSIVRSNAAGAYTNETRIRNTLDPRPFLGLTTNADGVLICDD